MKKMVLLGVLCALGLGSAVALAAVTGEVSACATVTGASHTVLVDGAPVATVGGDTATKCVTTTYTVPDPSTVTVTTGGTTTVPTTTTTPTTTSSSGTPTFASETAYTQTRPDFTVKRTVLVSSISALKTAIANLQPGDLVKASAPFTVSAGGTGSPLVIANRLTAPAEIDLTGVTVVYTGTADFASVWVKDVLNVRIFGGDISMTQGTAGGGSCIAWTASQHSLWWGFHAHDCGSGGIGIFTAQPGYSYAGPIEYDDIEGSVTHFSLNHGLFDPHVEKCSGVHGSNIADNNQYPVDHNRIALDVEDSACTGGGISFGSQDKTPNFAPTPDANTIILECANLSFVSTTQTGGNCYQTWGYGNTHTDLKYVVGSNLAGHNIWAGGLYGRPNSALASDTIEYARATSTDLNPRYAADCSNNKEGNPVFLDVVPTPCYKPFSS